MTRTAIKQTKFRNLWMLGICIHILTFLFVLDLYFTSPIKHGMTPHKSLGEPFAKRVVVFIADGLRAEGIYPRNNWDRVEFLSELRLNRSCSWGIVHTGVPTESRPGHVAIFAGLMEDPSALFTGWQANIVEFDSVINQSNYAWSYGSPDIVKIFTKKEKAKLTVDHYDPDQEDFSGRTSTINLDTWVFERVEELLTPKGNSCEAQLIRKSTQRRRLNANVLDLEQKIKECERGTDTCHRLKEKLVKLSLQQADMAVETLELYPCLYNFDKHDCAELCQPGNVFFLHLLGMDTVGHVHKPDSKEYLENLRAIDTGIRETVDLFHEYFRDNDTAFLFTADHGMTNWGSHGDGSEHETEVPYILWGRGVSANKLRQDLKQTDFAPLLSSLIGVPIPVNSVGILPHKLLNGTSGQISHSIFANVMQHVEQYKLLLGEFDLDPLFTEYPSFTDNHVEATVERMRASIKEGQSVVRVGEEFIKDILAANAYMRNYYFKPKVVTVMLGFVLWIIYLSLSIHVSESSEDPRESRKNANYAGFRSWRTLTRLSTLLLLILTFIYLKGVRAKHFTFIYPVFVLGIVTLLSEDRDVLKQFWMILRAGERSKFWYRTVIYSVLVQLLVFGFFHRMFCALVVVILAFWLTQNRLSLKNNAIWLCATCALALLQAVEPSTKFKYYGLGIGAVLWLGIYLLYFVPEATRYAKKFDLQYKKMTKTVILTPPIAFLVATANVLYIAWAFDTETGILDANLVISWVVTVAILFLIPMAPRNVLSRFGHICGSLIVPYALMAVNIDLVFYCVLVLTLYYWMDIESKMAGVTSRERPLEILHFSANYAPRSGGEVSDLFRRTYFYLALTVCYFFAIGNMASFNGFDPQWTRAYVATFNPFLMAALIIIKMVIPFFLITCAFYAIVLCARANDTKVFTVLLLFLDQMLMNFMLFVRNEGSWKEIGSSLSHFAVMEAMALVMLIFFGLARYVCSFTIGDLGYCAEDDSSNAGNSGGRGLESLIEEGIRKRRSIRPQDNFLGETSQNIKKNFWYFNEFISRPVRSLKMSKSDSSLSVSSSLVNFYVSAQRNASNLEVLTEKFMKTQEIQCTFEDEVVSALKTPPKDKNNYNVFKKVSENCGDRYGDCGNIEKIFAGTKKDIFKVAFDLGIAATIEHCHEKLVKKGETCETGKRHKHRKHRRSGEEQKTEENIVVNSKIVEKEVKIGQEGDSTQKMMKRLALPMKSDAVLKDFDELDIKHRKKCVNSLETARLLNFYDIFPTVDKIQSKELRTIFEKPFVYEEGYINVKSEFEKNAAGENIGMISHPSYDDVDCHFYSSQYSETNSRASLKISASRGRFKASYFYRKSYKLGEDELRKVKSVPHLETVPKVVGICKTSSENDLRSMLRFENSLEGQRDVDGATGGLELENSRSNERILKKQLEKFNLSKSVYSTMKPGLKVSSKISIIRTESYFKPDELAPAGSRVFRGFRTCFNSPDVLKLAPGLSREESAFHFMSNQQKQDLVKKLLASSRVKTPHEQNLIDAYFTQLNARSLSDSSSLSSLGNSEDRFELLHREALKNEKKRRKEYRERLRRLLKDAKRREDERLEYEEKMRVKAEEALRAEEAKLAKELEKKRGSSICLVPSQAVFNLGIKVEFNEEDTLKLHVPEGKSQGKIEKDSSPLQLVKEEKMEKKDTRALETFTDIIKKEPVLKDFLVYFDVDSIPERERKDSEEMKTKSPLLPPPAKKKKGDELETSSESSTEGTSKEKRKKRRKIKRNKKKMKCEDGGVDEDGAVRTRGTNYGGDQSEPTNNEGDSNNYNEGGTQGGNDASSTKTERGQRVPCPCPSSTASTSCDRYDKSCCARKRPSSKFIANAQEMAMKLCNLPGDSDTSEVSMPLARLPIRVAPGMLADGESVPSKDKVRSLKFGAGGGSLLIPREDVIKEERESLSMEADSSNSSLMLKKGRPEMDRRSERHKQFTKSSPTLIKINPNSTLVTDPKASEERVCNYNNSQEAQSQSQSDSDRMPNSQATGSIHEAEELRDFDALELEARLSLESMPDSMKLDISMDTLDHLSLYSDLPEDDVQEMDISKGRAACHVLDDNRLVSFQAVTTSLTKHEKLIRPEGGDYGEPNTCFDLVTSVRKQEIEADAVCTPRFMQEKSDPAKYLTKVENWLNSIDGKAADTRMKTQEVEDAPDASESSITSEDIRETCLEVLPRCHHVTFTALTGPKVEEQVLSSVEIAKRLTEDQRRSGQSVYTLAQAYQTVKFVLRSAKQMENASDFWMAGDRSRGKEKSTQMCTSERAEVSTQVSIDLPPIDTGTVRTKLAGVSIATQVGKKLSKSTYRMRSRCKSTQCSVATMDRVCWTDGLVEKTTTNVGIQHSFSDVGVNTDCVCSAAMMSKSMQSTVEMVDEEVGTFTVTKRHVGSQARIQLQGNEGAGEGLNVTALFEKEEDGGDSVLIDVPLAAPKTVFEATVESLREELSVKCIGRTAERNDPVLPDELCSKSQLEERARLSKLKAKVPRSPPTSPRIPKTPPDSLPTAIGPKYNSPLSPFISAPPVALNAIMSAFARKEAAKPYKPPPEVKAAIGAPDSRPKVRSVPRTDFAELPEEHQEVLADMPIPLSVPVKNKKGAGSSDGPPRKSPIMRRHTISSIQVTNTPPSAPRDTAGGDDNISAVTQRWRRQGMSEEQISKGVEKGRKVVD